MATNSYQVMVIISTERDGAFSSSPTAYSDHLGSLAEAEVWADSFLRHTYALSEEDLLVRVETGVGPLFSYKCRLGSKVVMASAGVIASSYNADEVLADLSEQLKKLGGN